MINTTRGYLTITPAGCLLASTPVRLLDPPIEALAEEPATARGCTYRARIGGAADVYLSTYEAREILATLCRVSTVTGDEAAQRAAWRALDSLDAAEKRKIVDRAPALQVFVYDAIDRLGAVNVAREVAPAWGYRLPETALTRLSRWQARVASDDGEAGKDMGSRAFAQLHAVVTRMLAAAPLGRPHP